MNETKKLSDDELLDICGGKGEKYWAFFWSIALLKI